MLKIPRIFLSTSRFPSSSLIKFVKELCLVFPNSKKINRGGKFLPSLVSFCLFNQATDILFLYENRGKPTTLVLVHLPNGPSIFFGLSNVTFHIKKKINLKKMSSPHVIIDNLDSDLGKRFGKIFASLFPQPSSKSTRVVTFSGRGKSIILSHHWFEKEGVSNKNLLLHRLGPNFCMHPFKIILGVIGEKEEKIEWTLTPFINSFKKKDFFNFF